MRLSPARFDTFLTGAVGQDLGWRKASGCPCVSANSGSPRIGCPVCAGKGVFWADEVIGRAAIANMSPQKATALLGSYEAGDSVLTVPCASPLYALARFDRIRVDKSAVRFSSVLQPGVNDRLMGSNFRLERVFWLADDGQTIVEGGLPAVADDGALTWESGAPPADRAYTVEGAKNLEFFVFVMLPSDRNSGAAGLPRKAPLRVIDLFKR